MIKFLPQKKKLLEEVFEKASGETPEKSFSGILKFLERKLQDDFKIQLSYKTFETYYLTIVENNQDYNIKTQVLDDLSKFLEYNNFEEYCAEWKTVEHTITEKPSKIVVHIVNKPLLRMPEFLSKQSNLGIVGLLLVGGFFAGNKLVGSETTIETTEQNQNVLEKETKNITPVGIGDLPEVNKKELPKYESVVDIKQKDCMYWNKDHYERSFCDENNGDNKLIAYRVEAGNLIKITRPDTLTIENAFGKIWYVKNNNQVEFFNNYGEHPENDKPLKKATKYIIEKYGKPKTLE